MIRRIFVDDDLARADPPAGDEDQAAPALNQVAEQVQLGRNVPPIQGHDDMKARSDPPAADEEYEPPVLQAPWAPPVAADLGDDDLPITATVSFAEDEAASTPRAVQGPWLAVPPLFVDDDAARADPPAADEEGPPTGHMAISTPLPIVWDEDVALAPPPPGFASEEDGTVAPPWPVLPPPRALLGEDDLPVAAVAFAPDDELWLHFVVWPLPVAIRPVALEEDYIPPGLDDDAGGGWKPVGTASVASWVRTLYHDDTFAPAPAVSIAEDDAGFLPTVRLLEWIRRNLGLPFEDGFVPPAAPSTGTGGYWIQPGSGSPGGQDASSRVPSSAAVSSVAANSGVAGVGGSNTGTSGVPGD